MPAAAHLHKLRASLDGPVTIGELAERLGREGSGLMILLISVPFLQPLPLAGFGTPIGILVVALGAQIALGRERLVLPRFVAERRLEGAQTARLLALSERALAVLERLARPRWKAAAASRRTLGTAVAALGVIQAIPIFVPLGNPVTGVPLLLLGASLAEEDGLLGVLGVGGAVFTWAYHAAFVGAIWSGGRSLFARWP